MHKLCLDAPTHFYGWLRWPLMHLDVLDVYWCTSCVKMHQGIHMDAQDDPLWSWMSPMSRVAQFVTRCTKGFIWILKMSIDAAGCLSLHKLYLDAATHFYGWLRWPLMELDVLDVYLWTSCALMHQHIIMDAECLWCPLMHLDVLDVYQCSWWT